MDIQADIRVDSLTREVSTGRSGIARRYSSHIGQQFLQFSVKSGADGKELKGRSLLCTFEIKP